MLVSGDRFCPECGTPQEPTGPVTGAPSGFMSVWDSVVRVLRSSLSGEYRITRELGRGGQAAVFQADEIALNRQVAIKVLAPGIVNGDRNVELFRREAQTIANLTHPHIVTVYSVREVDELHLFVMQYVEGRSLAAIIADRGPLPLTTVRAVAFQVGNALQYAHKRGVIHRDIKPANVLFDEDGNAIVTDFGIAKDISKGTSSTLTGGLLGTPAYMSPEQCNQLPVTWASDQYSLGVMLYEMLTGRVPFEGTAFTVMQGHTDREPPAIRPLRPDCPVELEWAVLRMLAKRPGERFTSFGEAMEALGATPLTRDDPIRGELKRLALGATPPVSLASMPDARLTLSLPERIEVGEPAGWELYMVAPGEAESARIPATLKVADESIARYDAEIGALIGVSKGRTSVTAESEQGAVTVDVEVIDARVASLSLTASLSQLEVGQTLRCRAEARDRRGEAMSAAITWESSTPKVLSVTREGVVRAIAPGAARVVARTGDLSDERAFVVLPAAAASIVVSPPPMSVEVLESFVLSAQVLDAQGDPLVGRAVQWQSSNDAVATIDAFGVVAAHAAGQVQFTARSGDAEARVALTVRGGVQAQAGGIEPLAPVTSAVEDGERALSGEIAELPLRSKAAEPIRPRPVAMPQEVAAPMNRGRLWAIVGGVAAVVVVGFLLLRNRDGGSSTAPERDPGISATALARFADEVPTDLIELGVTGSDPAFLDAFDAEPNGQRVVRDAVDLKAEWTPLDAGGLAAHTVIGTPSSATKSAALVIQGAERTKYLIELLNEPKATGLRVERQRASGRERLLNVAELPSRWVGAVSLDVVWVGTAMRIYLNGALVASPVEVGPPPKARVLLFARGTATFDDLAAVSLRAP
jgi:hypothetical protein